MIFRRFALIFAMVILSSLFVSGQGIIGISPANYFYKGVLRGGFSERPFIISFSSDESVVAVVRPLGEIADWISIPTNTSEVSKSNPWILPVAIEPPTDIPNGNYTGILRVRSEAIGGSGLEDHATGVITAVLDIALTVEIIDTEILKCQASNFEVVSAEKGDDLVFKLNVDNQGNVRLRPEVSIDLWDQNQISIVDSLNFKGDEILPTRGKDLRFKVSTDDLEIDQYWADVNVLDCFDSQTLSVDVFEPGALRAQGVLREILAPPLVNVRDTLEIDAVFENTGEKEVSARFKGQITLGDKIIRVLESEFLDVPLGEKSNFSFFFTPEKVGKYIVKGRVFYDKKRTFESSKVFEVIGSEFSIGKILLYIVYLVILLVITYLYFRIRKERRRYLKFG